MSISEKLKKRLLLWLSVILVLSLVSTATALTVQSMSEKMNIWSGTTQNTNFGLTQLEAKIKGKNKVDIKVALLNTDTAAHSANVTIQLLDSSGDVILEQDATTGSVNGGASWTSTLSFTQAGLVSQYSEALVIVKQTS